MPPGSRTERKPRLLGALGTALAITASGCGVGAGGGPEGSYSIALYSRPQTLLPQDAEKASSRRMVDTLFTGLVRYDETSSQPLLAVAESITSRDQRHWKITIEDGWTFHNGEPVTSESFVRAWRLLGTSEGPLGSESTRLSGLKIVDDDTFTVTLARPFSQFPMLLGGPAFMPLPTIAFTDPEGFREKPIGNGPYKMSHAWQHDGSVELTRYGDYPASEWRAAQPDDEDGVGEDEAEVVGEDDGVERLTYHVFEGPGAAYRALRKGAVDVVPSLPPARFDAAQDDFGSRFDSHAGATLAYLAFPPGSRRFDDPRLRRAVSMAIDRQEIVETYFGGVHTPAKALVSPAMPGSREQSCGDWCEYRPGAASRLFEAVTGRGAAEGVPATLTLWTGAAADRTGWAERVATMLERTLGIEKVVIRKAPPAAHDSRARAQRAGGLRLDTIVPAYPSARAYLAPSFTTGGDTQHAGYDTDRVRTLVQKGDRAGSIDVAMDHYRHAADIFLGDMPIVPLWFENASVAHSPSVSDVTVGAFGHVRVARVTES